MSAEREDGTARSRRPRVRALHLFAVSALGVGLWWRSAREVEPAEAASSAAPPPSVSEQESAAALLAQGIELFEDDFAAEARDVLERAYAVDPTNPEIAHRLALALLEVDEVERAEGLAESAHAARPDDARFVFGLAQVIGTRAALTDNPLTQMTLGTRSKKLLDRAVELDPALVDARYGRILFYLLAPALLGGGVDRAREEALAIGAFDRAAGLFAEGWVAEADEDFDRAEELHRSSLELDPAQSRPRFRLGYLLLGQERFDEARAQFAACLDLEPRDPRSHHGHARALFGQDDVVGARAGFERSLALQPDFAPSVIGLARCCAAEGDVAGARERYARYLELGGEGEGADEARDWLEEHPR